MFGPDGVGAIQGDAGFVTVAGGAKAGIIKKWSITRSGTNPDKSPRLRLRAQFGWLNETLMNLKMNGLPMKKRVVVQMKTKLGFENVDILDWDEARLEGGVLTLENVRRSEGIVKR
jgi:hypothetical protein